jgi:hypothetical protein
VPRHVARLVTRLVAPLVVNYFDYSRMSGCFGMSRGTSRGSSRGTSRRSSSTTSTTPRVQLLRHVSRHVARLITRLVAPLVVDYFDYAARPVASACCAAGHAARHAARRAARRRLVRLRRLSSCVVMSRGTSRGSSHPSSSTTPPRAGLSSTTSPPPRVRVPRHVARLVTRLIAPLVVHYSAWRRLVVDYFASTAHPGASARRVARREARH